MLGRRQLREKVMQSLYAYKSAGSAGEERSVEKNMFRGIDQIYDLYIYLLNLLKFQQNIAEHKIELARNKKLATAEDLNPNLKFLNNTVLKILDENEELNNYTQNNKQLSWGLFDTYPNSVYKDLINSDLYKDYMKSEKKDFEEDRQFILDLFEHFIANYEGLHDWLEGEQIHWADDLYIANTMVYATLKSFTFHSGPKIKLFKVYKDDEDKEFVQELFRKAIRYQGENKKIIEEKANNWEFDRIAMIDLIILEMALTEFKYFPSIPPKVTMNEYIELAKNYSTEKSRIFVNGILDRVLKEMKDDNKLSKYGRGLL